MHRGSPGRNKELIVRSKTLLSSLLLLIGACLPEGSYTPPPNNNPDDPDASVDDPPPPPPDPADAGPPDAPVGRAVEGLQALYEFDEGLGPAVHDTSNVGAPSDLECDSPGLTTWTPTGLRIDASTILRTNAPASKIISACMASNEITLEAWITPASTNTNNTQYRVFGISLDTDNRNISLFQSNADYQLALRTGATTLDGDPPLVVTGAVTTLPQHVVFTRDALGAAKVYVDGAEVATGTIGDTMANWDPSYELFIANEGTLNRGWLGTLHLASIYCRALTAAEVQRNYAEGY
jgi:hypothetical protein